MQEASFLKEASLCKTNQNKNCLFMHLNVGMSVIWPCWWILFRFLITAGEGLEVVIYLPTVSKRMLQAPRNTLVLWSRTNKLIKDGFVKSKW